MSTFIQTSIEGLESRFKEIDSLIELAEGYENSDLIKFNSICRAIQVLIISHFEGFLKDCVKEIIRDINQYGEFILINISIKRTFCEYFMFKNDKGTFEGKKEHNLKEKMIEAFNNSNIEIRPEPFLASDNKNPKASIIENILKKFGIKNFFKFINESKIDIVFSSTLNEIKELNIEVKNNFNCGIEDFPYDINIEYFELKPNSTSTTKTFWEEFIEKILQNRHNIVHGNTIENPESLQEIKRIRYKLEIFIYLIVSILCNQVKL